MPRRCAESRVLLISDLRARRAEIEAAIRARIDGDGGPTEAGDPEYGEGLRAAIPAGFEHCLAAIERGESSPPPVPTALLSQARLAARSGIPLDTVLRRYFAGYTLLGDFLIEEAEATGLRRGADLRRLLRSLSTSFDRLLAAVSAEHRREAEATSARSSGRRRAELIERLLAGEPLDPTELRYDVTAHHVGLLANGAGSEAGLADLARSLDCRLLALPRGEETVWAWLGSRGPLDPDDIERIVAGVWPAGVRLAIGEPAVGASGWRLTHRQAKAALSIVLRGPQPFVRYADIALLATMLQDDLLCTSLREIYLKPLEAKRDGGETLRETLRAYFATGRNVSSAAAVLGVSRNTVTSRLRAIEAQLGRSLASASPECEAALRLEEFTGADPAH